jgi:hypothetical protein
MERDATIARDRKRYGKRCHALPEGETLCKEMPFIARGFEKNVRRLENIGKT